MQMRTRICWTFETAGFVRCVGGRWCDLVRRWKPLEWAEEQGQIKSGVGPFLEKVARERSAYCVRSQFPTRGDKAVRAQSIRGRMAMRGLRIPPLRRGGMSLRLSCCASRWSA